MSIGVIAASDVIGGGGGGGAGAYWDEVFADSPWAAFETNETTGTSLADWAPQVSVATASSNYPSDIPANAFDGNAGTPWSTNGVSTGWLQAQLTAAAALTRYAITSRSGFAGRAPNTWTFEGSNDGSTWTTLDTQTGITWSGGDTKSYTFTNTTAYLYYRLNVTANNGDTYLDCTELALGYAPFALTPGRPMTVFGSPSLAQVGPDGVTADAVGFTSATSQYGKTTATSTHGILTYEAWVKLPANPTVVNGILARSDGYLSSGASDAELSIRTDGKIEWLVYDNVASRIITSPSPISLNTWHHIVASVGAAGMKMRIDKTTVATAAYTTAFTGAAMYVFLRGGGSRMSGHDAVKIARPVIYPSQLSDARTDAHYDAA